MFTQENMDMYIKAITKPPVKLHSDIFQDYLPINHIKKVPSNYEGQQEVQNQRLQKI